MHMLSRSDLDAAELKTVTVSLKKKQRRLSQPMEKCKQTRKQQFTSRSVLVRDGIASGRYASALSAR